MILGLCGRIRSGKSELSKICEKYGYNKLYFALPLKQLCSRIVNVSIEELNELKNNNTRIDLTINDDLCKLLSNETDIPYDVTLELCNGKTLNTVRELLQFVGTDYIREYNRDWHVNRIREMIDVNLNYVIDDVRFPNEKKLIDELGGHCWFVTRTTLDNISNHISETSITWKDCWNKVIINNSSLQELQFKWETFMEDYEHSCEIREREFNKILENGFKQNEIESLSVLSILMLPKALFEYVPRDIEKDNVKSITMNEDKSIFVKYKDDSLEMIDNPLLIEDIKKLL